MNPLVQIISIQTNTSYGQVLGGKLVLRGILFEIASAFDRFQKIKFKGHFHLDDDNSEVFEKTIYFLPLAEVMVRERERSFTGIYLNQIDESSYIRIGHCLIMDAGGEGYPLDCNSWERLLQVRSLEDFEQELIIF